MPFDTWVLAQGTGWLKRAGFAGRVTAVPSRVPCSVGCRMMEVVVSKTQQCSDTPLQGQSLRQGISIHGGDVLEALSTLQGHAPWHRACSSYTFTRVFIALHLSADGRGSCSSPLVRLGVRVEVGPEGKGEGTPASAGPCPEYRVPWPMAMGTGSKTSTSAMPQPLGWSEPLGEAGLSLDSACPPAASSTAIMLPFPSLGPGGST